MATAGLDRVLAAVEEERQALVGLLQRVIVLRLVLEAGEHRFVAACLDEVVDASARVTSCRSQRAAVTAPLCGGAAPRGVADLAATAPQPLRWMLTDHQDAIHVLSAELRAETERCRLRARAERAAAEEGMRWRRDPGMELELRRQACRGVLAVLQDLVPGGPRVVVVD